MNTEDTRTTGLDVVVEKLRALEEENQRLRAAIKKTLDENRHLADGDNCTLIHLKRAIGEDHHA